METKGVKKSHVFQKHERDHIVKWEELALFWKEVRDVKEFEVTVGQNHSGKKKKSVPRASSHSHEKRRNSKDRVTTRHPDRIQKKIEKPLVPQSKATPLMMEIIPL